MKRVLHRGNNNLVFSRGWIFFLAAASIFLGGFFVAQAQTSYTRSPSGDNITSPITINISFVDWSDTGLAESTSCEGNSCNYWGIGPQKLAEDVDYIPVQTCVESSTHSGEFTITLPAGNYTEVTFWGGETKEICESTHARDAYYGNYLEGNGTSVVFTATAAAGTDGGTTPTITVTYMPNIELLEPAIQSFSNFSGILPLKYKASDKDDELKNTGHGLKDKPVNIYYSPLGTFDRFPIAQNQSATGTVLWDTTSLADGVYRLILTVAGVDSVSNEKTFDNIVLNNTPPNFTVKTNPYFSKGEPIKLSIESSGVLKSVPTVTVSQYKHEAVKVKLTGDVLGKIFKGTYQILPGFDGPAKINIQGEDLAGNKSSTILGNDSFAVGVNPPPMPTIETPGKSISVEKANIPLVKGVGVNARKIILKVNGGKEYVQENPQNGRFQFENVALDPNFNKGKNIISVTVVDEKGAVSEPAIIEAFFNSPPQVNLIEPRGRLLKLNGLIRFSWGANDINNDSLKFGVDLSDDGGQSWKNLAQNLVKPEFTWDSSAFPDGSNYIVKISAFDGSLTGYALSDKIDILNDLPTIIFETSGEIFTSQPSKTLKGIVRSKKDLLAKLELSTDGGKSWREILPDDKVWDSNFEKFSFTLSSLKSGELKIILRGASVSKAIITNAQGLKITFDNVAPQLTTERLPDIVLTDKFIHLGGAAKDNLAGIKTVEYSIDDSKWYETAFEGSVGVLNTTFNINHPQPLADGGHKIKVRVLDRADNISVTRTQLFEIDATPPRIGSFMLKANGKIIFPNSDGVFEIPPQADVNLLLSIAGQPEKAELWLNEENLGLEFDHATNLWQSDFVFNKDGALSLKVKAEDSAGNKAEREIAKLSPPQNQNLPSTVKSETKQTFWQKILNLFRKTK